MLEAHTEQLAKESFCSPCGNARNAASKVCVLVEETVSREKQNPIDEPEPIREILMRVGDKWTVVILTALREKRMRFKDLHRAGQGISQRVLTASLRSLEQDGLLLRTAYPTVPPRVEYELSDRGHSLREVLDLVGAWMSTHRPAIEASRRCFDSERGCPGKPALIKW